MSIGWVADQACAGPLVGPKVVCAAALWGRSTLTPNPARRWPQEAPQPQTRNRTLA
jgi:hypothetical protein